VLSGEALAAALSVTTTADVASNFGACGNPAPTSPTGGSLREAICVANNLGAVSSTIVVPAGTYHLTRGHLKMGKVPGSNITLNGAGAGSTVIDLGGPARCSISTPSGVTSSIAGRDRQRRHGHHLRFSNDKVNVQSYIASCCSMEVTHVETSMRSAQCSRIR
jgi:hypothetical protein